MSNQAQVLLKRSCTLGKLVNTQTKGITLLCIGKNNICISCIFNAFKYILTTINAKQEKLKALKTQLKFRKEILQQKHEDSAVNMYSKRMDTKTVPLSVEELSINVRK